ncbi:hypothetical protein LINGRAHAP2_LOCUS19281, partial [Linum grandiflorum]
MGSSKKKSTNKSSGNPKNKLGLVDIAAIIATPDAEKPTRDGKKKFGKSQKGILKNKFK